MHYNSTISIKYFFRYNSEPRKVEPVARPVIEPLPDWMEVSVSVFDRPGLFVLREAGSIISHSCRQCTC